MINELPKSLSGYKIFMVGIKGTGMAAMAELLKKQGAIITGSDVSQRFFTDTLLEKAGIEFFNGFDSKNIKSDIKLIIHSSAYNEDNNPELAIAKKLNIPALIYTEALGYVSSLSTSIGISGIHGKTTTTAITGTIVKELGLPVSVLVGSGVPTFSDSAIYVKDNKYFIAETCEYHRHFLDFHPEVVLVTSLEMDHPDYFKDYEDIVDAFISYIKLIPKGGELIYCADDKGVLDLYERVSMLRDDIKFTPYGERALGDYKITTINSGEGTNNFTLAGFETVFKLQVPGHHTVLDAAGGVAVAVSLLNREGIHPLSQLPKIESGLFKFRGTKRRSEIVANINDILFIDDYGHHPTAIETTLKGLKEFYPNRRLIVDFMSHTYTRTEELLEEFASSFSSADIVLLNKIYSSAREGYNGRITGETLYQETKKRHREVYYCPEYKDAVNKALDILKPGDLFVTMGAGNNWQVGETLIKELEQ